MTPNDAAAIVASLSAAFPRTNLAEETVATYIDALKPWDAELGKQAAKSVLYEARGFPSLAMLREHYGVVREQRRRDIADERRREENAAYDNFEPVPMEEIVRRFPEVGVTLEKFSDSFGLPREGSGTCSDCDSEAAPLYRLNKFTLCSKCAGLRVRAGKRLVQMQEREKLSGLFTTSGSAAAEKTTPIHPHHEEEA